MKSIKKRFLEILFIYIFSGIVYVTIEIIYRGRSDISMFLLAGLCGIFIAKLNDYFTYEMDFCLQIFICTLFNTFMEWLTGMIVNTNFNIWDYRGLYGTFANEQLNIFFIFAWALISIFAIPILDYIEWKIFKYKEEIKPYYKILGRIIYLY